MTLLNDETPLPAGAPPATPEDDNSRMLALALLGLGSTGLGALMGGREGAMLGATQGLGAGASVLAHDAKALEEQRKLEAAEKKRAEQKEEDFAEFTKREDYKNENKGAGKEAKPETRSGSASIVERQPDGTYKEVYTPPAKAKGGGGKVPDPIKGEDSLRKERDAHPTTRRTDLLRSAYGSLAASRPDAAGDMALIFGYMKMLDPATGVKEGEYANAQNAAGVPERIRNAYNAAKDGTRLSEDQRTQFKGQAKAILDVQEKTQGELDNQYVDLAKQRGLKPGNVVRIAPTPAGSAGTSVRMINPKSGERFDVPAADITDAEKDGFVRE